MNVTVGQVSIALVDDEAISRLKNEYFGRPEATDVISFDLRDSDNDALDCEIVINTQKALREAEARHSEPGGEINLYLVHGLLHQLGYDDRSELDAVRMHQKEDQLLVELGFGTIFGGTG